MNAFHKLILSLRSVGLGTTLRTSRSSLYRDWLDRRHAQPQSNANHEPPGALLQAKGISSGGMFNFERAELEIKFLAPDLVRVSWGPGTLPVPYAIDKEDWPDVETEMSEEHAGWFLSSLKLSILVRPDGSLHFEDRNGKSLRNELPPVRQGSPAGPCSWRHTAILEPEERLYGLGEQAGRLDLRGRSYRMWNTDPGGSYGPGTDPLYAPIPVYLGLLRHGGYLVFYENYHPAQFRFPAPTASTGSAGDLDCLAEAQFEGGLLRYYFITGEPARVVERYTQLTGRPELPPLWSLGYHQSRWGYKSESDIRQVAAGFLEHDLPVSAIHLDIDYMDDYRVFTVDALRFPDLKRLSGEMEKQGIRLVTILDPAVKQDPDYFLYQEGINAGVFCAQPEGETFAGLVWPGWSVFPDFTNPKVRTWWGAYYPRLLDSGIAGIWHDMNEPASFAAWGQMTLPHCIRHDMEGQGGDHRQGHNLYALQMNRAGYEALRRHRPGRRPWIISRSGWAGQQRYAWNWTGDTESTWAALRMTIPSVLGMGLSGLPFVGPDIGGFSGSPDAELYLRSFQMSAFLPFFRTHSSIGTGRREPWVYGEPYTSILRKFLKLRYRLLPYLYTLARDASQTGHPLVRPLFWDDPQDTSLWAVEDAFLLGKSLLVAPILDQGTVSRQVTLPHGGWYNFWDDTPYHGLRDIVQGAALESIPLFVRSGSLLPMQAGSRLLLHLYAPQDQSDAVVSQIYSDAGDGYGDWRLDRFSVLRDRENLRVSWEVTGDYPFPYAEVEIHLHGFTASRAWLDGQEIACRESQVNVPLFRNLRLISEFDQLN